ESFAKKAIELAANHAEARIADAQRGSPTYVPHLAAAVTRLAATDAFGTHHIAGSGGCSRLEFVGELYGRLGISTRLVPAKTADFPAAARRPSNSALTTSRQRAIELPPGREGVAEFASRARD
ncbi:MAG: NAD(P)-dependent oxidoreductase, partial [Planctomycetes bacterium]|nr:NAD(P)-dependent oxidoreductase [Planctomycetota bacterium]